MTEMNPGPTVLVVQPDAADPLGRFEGWLQDAGIHVQLVRPYAGEPVPRTLEADGLIVLGGKMSANDDAEHPWLDDVRALQADAVAHDRPALGICLGAQLLSQALGGRVVEGDCGFEAGLTTVCTTEAAGEDPLFSGVAPQFLTASMHGDMIEVLPPDAVLLGSSDDYPHQAFRVGQHAWGMQFHPEIAPATYAVWADLYDSEDPDQLERVARGVAELESADADVRRSSAVLALRFGERVTEAAQLRLCH